MEHKVRYGGGMGWIRFHLVSMEVRCGYGVGYVVTLPCWISQTGAGGREGEGERINEQASKASAASWAGFNITTSARSVSYPGSYSLFHPSIKPVSQSVSQSHEVAVSSGLVK